MNKDRFMHHCLDSEGGKDAFVSHPATGEEGRVVDCNLQTGHLVVQTAENQKRCWDYKACEDLKHPKTGPMV